MAEAALLPRPADTAEQTSAYLSLARTLQLVEVLEGSLHAVAGRGIFDRTSSGGSRGAVTKTADWTLELEADTPVYDSGKLYLTPTAASYVANTGAATGLFLWGILERTAADPYEPTELDTYGFRLKHTTDGNPPVETGISADRWIPLATWEADGSGILGGTLDDFPAGKYITEIGEALSDIAATVAEVQAARGSMASLDARLDVSLNEDGTLKTSSIDWKPSVRVASTGNVNTAAPGASIDGVALSNGDRVLLKDQTTASQNGVWVWNGAASAMTRAGDADSAAEVTAGMIVPVTEGDENGDTLWALTTDDAITLGSTSLAFKQLAAARHREAFTVNVTQARGTIVKYRCDFTERGAFGQDYLARCADREGISVEVLDNGRDPDGFWFEVAIANDAPAESYGGAGTGLDLEWTLSGYDWAAGSDPDADPVVTEDDHDFALGGSGGGGGGLNHGIERVSADGTVLSAAVGTHYVTSADELSVYLPAAPADGDLHTVFRTFGSSSTPCHILRSGSQVIGVAGTSFDLPGAGASVTFVWDAASNAWWDISFKDAA